MWDCVCFEVVAARFVWVRFVFSRLCGLNFWVGVRSSAWQNLYPLYI